MTSGDGNGSFEERFIRFFDECSDDEQLFLAWLLSGQVDPSSDRAGDVEGFALPPLLESGMSFNVQYSQLQNQMQNEARSYAVISAVMRSKHDTVMKSISDIR